MSLLTLLAVSCSTDNGYVLKSTPQFDSTFINADRIYDAGNPLAAYSYIRQEYEKQKKYLTVIDKLNYYAYANILYSSGLHDYNHCLNIADTMLSLIRNSGMADKLNIRTIQAMNIKADALNNLSKYDEAYSIYYKAMLVARENSDSCSLSTYSYSLGMILYKQMKYPNAAEHFKTAILQMAYCPDEFRYFYRKQEILDNIGICYSKLGNYDSAIIYYDSALKFIEHNRGKYPQKTLKSYEMARAVVCGNMSDVYKSKGKVDSATTLLKQSIAVNLQKGYANNDAILSQIKLAKIYLETNKLNDLTTTLKDIKVELDTIPNKQVQIEWNKLMWHYYEVTNNSALAYQHVVKYTALNDTFIEQNKKLMNSDVEGRFNNLEKEYNNKLAEKSAKVELLYKLGALLVFIATIIIALIWYRNAARNRRNLLELQKLNVQINEQKHKLEEALAGLETRDRDKSRILRSVAHDVMSPISAIAALVDILIHECTDVAPEYREMFDMIRKACENSLNLSRDILDAAVEISPDKLPKEWVDIKELVKDNIDLLNVKAASKKQKIEFEVSDSQSYKAFVNKNKIGRVVNNLIGNAIKFSYENSKIQVSLLLQNKEIEIIVKDTGVGIPLKAQKHVFDMFTESKSYGTNGEKPHGIGLSICLQIAKAHGGKLWFVSRENEGSEFHFTFPIDIDNIGNQSV